MNPDIDLSTLGLTAYEETIARAMQEYGLYVVDAGGESGIGLYAIDPRSVEGGDLYDTLLPDADFVLLDNIPINAETFRVLQLPPQDSDWQDALDLTDTGCNDFR